MISFGPRLPGTTTEKLQPVAIDCGNDLDQIPELNFTDCVNKVTGLVQQALNELIAGDPPSLDAEYTVAGKTQSGFNRLSGQIRDFDDNMKDEIRQKVLLLWKTDGGINKLYDSAPERIGSICQVFEALKIPVDLAGFHEELKKTGWGMPVSQMNNRELPRLDWHQHQRLSSVHDFSLSQIHLMQLEHINHLILRLPVHLQPQMVDELRRAVLRLQEPLHQ